MQEIEKDVLLPYKITAIDKKTGRILTSFASAKKPEEACRIFERAYNFPKSSVSECSLCCSPYSELAPLFEITAQREDGTLIGEIIAGESTDDAWTIFQLIFHHLKPLKLIHIEFYKGSYPF